jgi:hypothetical protein
LVGAIPAAVKSGLSVGCANAPLLAAIAREYQQGRLLLIGTTVWMPSAPTSGTSVQSPLVVIRAPSISSARSCARRLLCLPCSSR